MEFSQEWALVCIMPSLGPFRKYHRGCTECLSQLSNYSLSLTLRIKQLDYQSRWHAILTSVSPSDLTFPEGKYFFVSGKNLQRSCCMMNFNSLQIIERKHGKGKCML